MKTRKSGDQVSNIEYEAFYPTAFRAVWRRTTSRSAAVLLLAELAARAREDSPLEIGFDEWDQNRKPLNKGGFRSAISDANKLLREYRRNDLTGITTRLAEEAITAEGLGICFQKRETALGDRWRLTWVSADRKRAPIKRTIDMLESYPSVAKAALSRGIDTRDMSKFSGYVSQPNLVSDVAAVLALIFGAFAEEDFPLPMSVMFWWWCFPPCTWAAWSSSGDALAVASLWPVPESCAKKMLKDSIAPEHMISLTLHHFSLEDPIPSRYMYVGGVAFAPGKGSELAAGLLHAMLNTGLKAAIEDNRVEFPLTVVSHAFYPHSQAALQACGFAKGRSSATAMLCRIQSRGDAALWPLGSVNAL